MRSLSCLALVVVCLGVAGFSQVAGAQALKIAVVNMQRALNEVEDGKRAKDALKREFEEKQKQLEILKSDLKKMREDLEKQKLVSSEEVMQTKAKEFQDKFLDLQNKAQQYEQDLKTRENESVQAILLDLRDLVQSKAAKDGYDLVFENSQEIILYSAKTADITSEVISAYNSMPAGKKRPALPK